MPSFLIGLGLFLSDFGLLFYSGERFVEGSLGALPYRKWDFWVLLLNAFEMWGGLSLMLVAGQAF